MFNKAKICLTQRYNTFYTTKFKVSENQTMRLSDTFAIITMLPLACLINSPLKEDANAVSFLTLLDPHFKKYLNLWQAFLICEMTLINPIKE